MGFRVEALQKRYDGRLVLDIPELVLPAGRSTVLLGPNGSGKSTLLRLLAAVEAPTAGRVLLDGAPLAGEATPLEVRRRVTLVMQEPFLFRGGVLRNVLYGLLARGVPRREALARARAALAQVGLGGFEERPSRSLSGGEAQRVALARALALEAPALLLDEPSAHVDAESLSRILGVLGELRRGGGEDPRVCHPPGLPRGGARRPCGAARRGEAPGGGRGVKKFAPAERLQGRGNRCGPGEKTLRFT